MIKNKLQYWLESQNILPKSQSGFRKGQCTIDNLTNLLLTAEDSFSERKDLHAAFLDVIGAFDNVIIDLLLQKLADIGLKSNFIGFIKFLTFKRNIYTNDLGDTVRKVYSTTYRKVSMLHSLLTTLLFIATEQHHSKVKIY